MSRLRVRHVTGYRYGGNVTQSYNEARMLPQSGNGQFVLASNLEISPISSSAQGRPVAGSTMTVSWFGWA